MKFLCHALVPLTLAGCDVGPQKDRSLNQRANEASQIEVASTDDAPAASKKPPPVKKSPPPKEVPAECPGEMLAIEGGSFWVGTEREVYDREENPKFKTRVTPFCAAKFEVSTAEFEDCVEAGKCEPARGKMKTCNTVAKGRAEHPINCIDHFQAVAVCSYLGGRLPTEVEWEYLARGGEQMRKYPWGDAHPDGNTCWKNAGTCERGKFTEGAFGLHDVVGNLWEWTDTWYGRHPWPQAEGRHKIYKGGSWSRRFEKWMRPTLRNRLDPKKSGSHLGVRCVADLPGAECAYGTDDRGACRSGVEEVLCLDKEVFNGARCAVEGVSERCPKGAQEVPGHGCVKARVSGPGNHKLDTAGVSRARSPQFDADCVQNSPGRPLAYRFTGGGHLARNVVGKSLGCKNRDVGVGFNSSCCP